MKLITFQTEAGLKELIDTGCLECNPQYIDLKKYGPVYSWVTDKMAEQVENREGAQYPVWCWVKFKNSICPPRHKGKPLVEHRVKIIFHKQPEEVFVTDYRRYSFLLNYRYIPESLEDKELFEEKADSCGLQKDAVTGQMKEKYPEICKEIERSFDRCITYDSDVLQGCVWRILLSEVEKIEFLHDTDYQYGSFNYVRANGKRFSWIEDFYRRLQ